MSKVVGLSPLSRVLPPSLLLSDSWLYVVKSKRYVPVGTWHLSGYTLPLLGTSAYSACAYRLFEIWNTLSCCSPT